MDQRKSKLRDLTPADSNEVKGGISNQPFTPHSSRLTLRRLTVRSLSVKSISPITVGTLETGPPPTAGC